MVEIDYCDDKKRQLPLWMTGVAAADQIRKSASEKGNHPSLEMKISYEDEDANLSRRKTRKTVSLEGDIGPSSYITTHGSQNKAKRMRKNERASFKQDISEKDMSGRLGEESAEIDDGSLSAEGGQLKDLPQSQSVNNLAEESLTRIEKEVIMDEKEDSEIDFEFLEIREPKTRSKDITKRNMKIDIVRNKGKNEGKSAKRTTHKRGKTKDNDVEISEEIETLSSGGEDNDSEAELTIDDLMHMAEEHIKADKEKKSQKRVAENFKSKDQCLRTSFSSEYENVSLNADGNIWKEAMCTSTAPTSVHTDAGDDNVKSPDIHILPTANRTGDPKIDMLDLFLGPLIRKSQKEVKKVDAITDNLIFDCEDNKQIKPHMVVGNKVPVMKKKSSLRDQVTMFLG